MPNASFFQLIIFMGISQLNQQFYT